MLTAYFDCFSGISGDMTLGALVDLGVPVEWLEESLRNLPLSGFELSAASVNKGGIQAVDVRVDVKDTETARNYAVIKNLIESSDLNERVNKLSGAMFRRIGEAEARVARRTANRTVSHRFSIPRQAARSDSSQAPITNRPARGM